MLRVLGEPVDVVTGVTQLHNVVYLVCDEFSSILRFNATTHQRLENIKVNNLSSPRDIAACEQTSRLYVADSVGIWGVSADGADTKRWWPKSSTDTFKPWTVSVMSTRLLVMSLDTKQLMQLDADGNELRRVQLPDYMKPYDAVESPTGTFIVSHGNTQERQLRVVSEVNTDGEVLRQFSSGPVKFGELLHVAVDSRANILVADSGNRHILLLSVLDSKQAKQLKLRRVIVDEHQLHDDRMVMELLDKDKQPKRLCYVERTGQLLVGFWRSVAVFDVLRR